MPSVRSNFKEILIFQPQKCHKNSYLFFIFLVSTSQLLFFFCVNTRFLKALAMYLANSESIALISPHLPFLIKPTATHIIFNVVIINRIIIHGFLGTPYTVVTQTGRQPLNYIIYCSATTQH